MSEPIYTAQDEGKRVQRLFQVNVDALKKSAPRAGGDPARLIRIAYNAIVFDEKLRRCTQASLMGGVLEALKLGLTLGGPMQEAWLIPFKDNRQNALVATFIVGYQGYRNIIDRGRSVLDLNVYPVHQKDEFDYRYGDNPFIHHKPAGGEPAKKDDLKAVYAVARLRGGGIQRRVLMLEDVERHRMRSRAKDSGPWVTDYVPMAMKTVIRVEAKYLPKSSDLLARALDLDERADRGVDQDFDIEGLVLPGEEQKALGAKNDAPTALDQLKDRLTKPEAEPALRTDPAAADAAENARLDQEIIDQERNR